MEAKSEKELKKLQLSMLRIQQGLWHTKRRAVIVFEGFDAAGKGGAIRRLTETLDPRSVRVFHIGPPSEADLKTHYLARFWKSLPSRGTIAVFDRSWYGRLLVERVDQLTSRERIEQSYAEINEFEASLVRDGIDVVKVFLAIHKGEQLRRFESRLKDPYKQWKLTTADIEAHRQWAQYVSAADELLKRTHTSIAPWRIIAADSKPYARVEALRVITIALEKHLKWMNEKVRNRDSRDMVKQLKRLRSELSQRERDFD
jgi:polyphosphate kinase 2 (PPK2 family)